MCILYTYTYICVYYTRIYNKSGITSLSPTVTRSSESDAAAPLHVLIQESPSCSCYTATKSFCSNDLFIMVNGKL